MAQQTIKGFAQVTQAVGRLPYSRGDMFEVLEKEEIRFINSRPSRHHPLEYDYGYIGGIRKAQQLAAQQSVHLTAFGVGMLAFCVIYFVLLFELLRKYGGK